MASVTVAATAVVQVHGEACCSRADVSLLLQASRAHDGPRWTTPRCAPRSYGPCSAMYQSRPVSIKLTLILLLFSYPMIQYFVSTSLSYEPLAFSKKRQAIGSGVNLSCLLFFTSYTSIFCLCITFFGNLLPEPFHANYFLKL